MAVVPDLGSDQDLDPDQDSDLDRGLDWEWGPDSAPDPDWVPDLQVDWEQDSAWDPAGSESAAVLNPMEVEWRNYRPTRRHRHTPQQAA